MAAEYRLGELARRVGGKVVGDERRAIRGVATLDTARPDEISFLTNPRYRDRARATRAGALLVPPASGVSGPDLLEVGEPYLALAQLLELFHPLERQPAGVSPASAAGADAVITS